MPTFMDSLASSPGNSGIYGQSGPASTEGMLGIVNQLKDREMKDFKDKATFMSDLSLKQERLRSLFDPEQSKQQQQPMQSRVAADPNQMTGYEKGELGVRQQGMNLESQKLAQTGKLGQEALDIKGQQENLNKQKSDQINATKQADMQRKIDESSQKIELAQKALENKNNNAEQSLQAHKDMAAAVEERHKLEMSNMQSRFDTTSQQHQQTIDNLTNQLKQRGRSRTTTEINPNGTKKEVTTERGDAADSINVIGKDGKSYTIPKDKLNDMDSDGTPHWKQQSDDSQSQDQ